MGVKVRRRTEEASADGVNQSQDTYIVGKRSAAHSFSR